MRTLALISLVAMLAACTSITSKPTFQTESGALRGYDPVAYFTEERAVKGYFGHHDGA